MVDFRELHQLTASELIKYSDESSSLLASYLRACQNRTVSREELVQAWAALEEPLTGDTSLRGALRGIPIGVKDIYDTRSLPTTWGTDYIRVENSVSDAALVSLLKHAGGLIMGKTVSTEFAYFTPGKTRNPHDIARTPGGSSSGSAAAVADGMVPISIGTQTAGSITRPASFCGVIGFKPTFGILPTAGIKQFSQSLDTPGYFARSISDIALVHSVLTGGGGHNGVSYESACAKIAICRIPRDGPLDNEMSKALDRTRERLRDLGHVVEELQLPSDFDELVHLQSSIMAYEAGRSLAAEFCEYAADMGPKLVEIIEKGLAISSEEYLNARVKAKGLVHELDARLQEIDLIISPSAIGQAPAGHETTGDPLYSRAWTLAGLPTVSLPVEKSDAGMPLGMQLIGRRYGDLQLMCWADQIIRQLVDSTGTIPIARATD